MRCVCCNKVLNDRELHLKDSMGNFRDSCAECLSWIQNPDQDMLESILEPKVEGVYVEAFPALMHKIHGFRTGELWVLTAPSGVGKRMNCIHYVPQANSDEDVDDDSCIVYDISTDTDLGFDK